MKKTILSTISLALLLASCGAKPTSSKTLDTSQLETIDLSAMDTSIKAADDFFLYANGAWIQHTQIPASESRWGSFNELEQHNNEKLSIILKDASMNQGPKGSQNQLLGSYYSSFMNMDLRNRIGFTPLMESFALIDSMKSTQDLVAVVAKLHREGVGAFFGFGVGQDLMNVDRNISYLGQGGLGLPNRDYYFEANKQDIREAYLVHISKCLELAQIPNARAKSQQILDFEIKLAQTQLRPAEMREPEKTYNPKHLKDVTLLFGTAFPFTDYLTQLGAHQADTIIVSNPSYISALHDLLEKSDPSVLKSYLTWSVLNHYAGHLSQDFVTLNFLFYEGKLSGKKEPQTMNEQVIDEITNMEIGELLGKAFVEKHFSKAAQDRVNEMVDNLLYVYRERINSLDWMSEATKKEALNKLNSIGRKLGFPSTWEDYSMLDFSADRYYWNYREMNRYSVQKNLQELSKPVDKNKWGMPAHMVNAYYHPLLNEIAFPAGIMQAPFFDEKAEDAVNYGRIGMVIGHEFTHGFDDMGSKFAADGSFKNWWTEEDRALFEQKTKLLGATFAGFCPMNDLCVNPELTMGENIADLGGLTMAYYAYARTDEFKRNQIRNGFTPAQRFFIAYAQLWKIKYTDAEMKKRLATDPHSPGMYRVNGPLKNCPEFFEAFQIPEGHEMRNDTKKVARIW
ncbi:MAG: hypothetical protein RLZZ301_846 [Bacteroidota bacterium]|jgi:putative endopeptidase